MATTSDFRETLAELAALERREARRRGLLCAALLVLFALALALVLAELGAARWAAWLFALGVGAAAVLALWLGFFAARREPSTTGARLAEQLAPELGTAPSSAAFFARQGGAGYSEELAKAHIARTGELLAAADLPARYAAIRARGYKRARVALLVATALAVAAFVGLARGRSRLGGLLFDRDAVELQDAPLIADLRVTYRYPSYTGLTPHIVEGGDGSLSALLGTAVVLEASLDQDARAASLIIEQQGTTTTVPLKLDGRRLRGELLVQHDGGYRFALTTFEGVRLQERRPHAITAVADAPPRVSMLSPTEDLTLRDDLRVPILYDAKDDFGLERLELVVEVSGKPEPMRLPVAAGDGANKQLEGSYAWATAELGLAPGAEARFYLEATDNDALSGPKRGVSTSRRLVLFSAQKHHEDLLARARHIADLLVDLLAAELLAPAGKELVLFERLIAELSSLLPLLREDKLAPPDFVAAFANVREHLMRAARERSGLFVQLTSKKPPAALPQLLRRERRDTIARLERDIIYLDDLLATARIDELKQNAKELLSQERELQKLLAEYGRTKDPKLAAELLERLGAIKDRMLEVLRKMSAIKQKLPGEYRNLEAASELAVSDVLERIERALEQDRLEDVAKEVEQLASLIENMSDRLDQAESEYGGERYAETKAELAELSAKLAKLERAQRDTADRAQKLSRKLHEKTIARAGGSLDAIVKAARAATASAFARLDRLALPEDLFGITGPLELSRQHLIDLDGLLLQRDLAESLRLAEEAKRREAELLAALEARVARYGEGARELIKAASDVKAARRHTSEVSELLRKLFAPAEEVLSREELAQVKGLERKQEELTREAGKLGGKMEGLAEEVPLFGGEVRALLEGARGEMEQAKRTLGSGALPSAAKHTERAHAKLTELYEALARATKSGGGKLPFPLTLEQGGGEGGGAVVSRPHGGEVHIPAADKNRAGALFREELLRAAKQKPPEHYEDAARRYYEELIR